MYTDCFPARTRLHCIPLLSTFHNNPHRPIPNASISDQVTDIHPACLLPACLQIIYVFLQSIVMLMLMVRLLSHVSFQPRLGVIARTLGNAAPQVAHFLVPFIITMVMFGATACITFYWVQVSGWVGGWVAVMSVLCQGDVGSTYTVYGVAGNAMPCMSTVFGQCLLTLTLCQIRYVLHSQL